MASSSSSATSLSSSILLSQSEKAFIRAGCRDDCRLDGRKRHDFSTYTLSSTATPSTTTAATSSDYPETLYFSNGSARLLANTADPTTSSNLQILCSVKADIVRPAPEKPNQGLIELHVDSMLQQQQSSRSSNIKKLEQLQAALQQLVLQNDSVGSDALQLCLVQGEYAWRLSIDMFLMPAVDTTSTGRWLDACSHVLRAALQSTKLPAIEVVLPMAATTTTTTTTTTTDKSTRRHELLVDGDVHHSHNPMLHQQVPIIVTVTVIPTTTTTTATSSKVGGGTATTPVLLLDATAAEEASAMAVVHVAFVLQENSNYNAEKKKDKNKSNKSNDIIVCGIRLQGSLPTACLPECIATATEALQDGRIDRAYRPCQTDDNIRHGQNALFLPPSILLQ